MTALKSPKKPPALAPPQNPVSSAPEGPHDREKNTQPETGAQTLLFLSLWRTLVLFTDRCLSAVIQQGRRWKGIMCITQEGKKEGEI